MTEIFSTEISTHLLIRVRSRSKLRSAVPVPSADSATGAVGSGSLCLVSDGSAAASTSDAIIFPPADTQL